MEKSHQSGWMFLKCFYNGELIYFVGRDVNIQIFLIAWEIVCVENKENWKRFFDNHIDDLECMQGFAYENTKTGFEEKNFTGTFSINYKITRNKSTNIQKKCGKTSI